MPDARLTLAEDEVAIAGARLFAARNWLIRLQEEECPDEEELRQARAAVQALSVEFKRAMARVAKGNASFPDEGDHGTRQASGSTQERTPPPGG